jgi:hypothetical protein
MNEEKREPSDFERDPSTLEYLLVLFGTMIWIVLMVSLTAYYEKFILNVFNIDFLFHYEDEILFLMTAIYVAIPFIYLKWIVFFLRKLLWGKGNG